MVLGRADVNEGRTCGEIRDLYTDRMRAHVMHTAGRWVKARTELNGDKSKVFRRLEVDSTSKIDT